MSDCIRGFARRPATGCSTAPRHCGSGRSAPWAWPHVASPVRILHGDADAGMPAAEFREMEETLKAVGKAVEVAI
jgi:hypothetical protein